MDYNDTYTSEIFRASQCLEREATVTTVIRQCLADHGFQPIPQCRDVYHRGDQRAVISVVDDVEHVNYQHAEDVWNGFTDRDVIITDNYVTRPTLARIVNLPVSWFGIYAYRPKQICTEPTKSYSLPVNRIDANRTMILLRMAWQRLLDRGHINFNCCDHSQNQDHSSRISLWNQCCEILRVYQGPKYDRIIQELSAQMPLRTHEWDIDLMIQNGLYHVVIETYASDVCVAFSEKTFRALQTARPWMMFAGTWAVARLQSLGFDVMPDIIDHYHWDSTRMNDDKITKFVDGLQRLVELGMDVNMMLGRAQQAAQHNQRLLQSWRQQWWQDLPDFLDQLNSTLEKS